MWWRNTSNRPEPGPIGPAPAGRRADWRLLLVDQPRGGIALLGLGPAENWQWLVDDGWTGRVITDLAERAERAERAEPGSTSIPVEAIIIGPPGAGERAEVVDRCLAALAPGGTVVVLGGRHRLVTRTLRRRGLGAVRRYLAVPDARSPNRLIPLDHPGGLAWLAGPSPALSQAAVPRGRRALRAILRRVGAVIPELFGDAVVVASVPDTARPRSVPVGARLLATPRTTIGGTEADPAEDAVVITSGFDEGSRTVVLPLGPAGPSRSQPAAPLAVVKVVARPAYRQNARREQAVLGRLVDEVSPAGLVPTPLGSVEAHGLTAVIESYAGRWTASAVLNEQRSLQSRAALLEELLGWITVLARTGARAETWNQDGFDALIGRWFDRLDRSEGPDPDRQALRRDLQRRSEALDGHGLLLGLRHFDLGPWNVVFGDRDGPGPAPVTVVDWELADPRTDPVGPVGADHLYFVKYWLHIARGCRSIDDELEAFSFLAPVDDRAGSDPRTVAARATVDLVAALDLRPGFVPLLEAHVWSEAACHQAGRGDLGRDRAGDRGPGGGGPARYLATLAHHRAALLAAWPHQPDEPAQPG